MIDVFWEGPRPLCDFLLFFSYMVRDDTHGLPPKSCKNNVYTV